MKTSQKVAVVGASAKEERYSNKAMRMLAQYGHQAIPIAVGSRSILGCTAYERLDQVPEVIDTVTLYVGAARQPEFIEQIVALHPKRVIFNPGTENPAACERLQAAGIEATEACTLVLLRTGQF